MTTTPAEQLNAIRLRDAADGLLCQMLALVDECMSTTEESPTRLTVGPATLAVWAEAIEAYESLRFSSHAD